MKYKVGDEVTVRRDLKPGEYGSGSAVSSMVRYAGEKFIIESVYNHGIYTLTGTAYWSWTDEMLEDQFKRGDILIDTSDKEYYFVGYGHGGDLIVQDEYDGSYDVRTWNYKVEGELRLKTDITEYTVEEIAKKLGIEKGKLRIKE